MRGRNKATLDAAPAGLPASHLETAMDDERRRAELEARLAAAQAHLATAQRNTVAYKDALSAVRHLERVMLGGDGLPPTVNPHETRRRP